MKNSRIVFESRIPAGAVFAAKRSNEAGRNFGSLMLALAGNGGHSNRRGRYSILPYKKLNGAFARTAVAKWKSEDESD